MNWMLAAKQNKKRIKIEGIQSHWTSGLVVSHVRMSRLESLISQKKAKSQIETLKCRVIKRVLGLFHLVRSRCDAILVVVVATVTDGSNPVLLYALHILVLLLLLSLSLFCCCWVSSVCVMSFFSLSRSLFLFGGC